MTLDDLKRPKLSRQSEAAKAKAKADAEAQQVVTVRPAVRTGKSV